MDGFHLADDELVRLPDAIARAPRIPSTAPDTWPCSNGSGPS